MTELSAEALLEIEERKIALDELKEDNRALESRRAHELALSEKKAATKAQGVETSGNVSVSMIAVLSAVVGGMSSFGAAYVAGLFDIENSNVVAQSNFELEKQKFANKLISNALGEESDRERALRLKFMVDIGLFGAELKPEIIRQYAEAEAERIEQGSQGESLLPSAAGTSAARVDAFFWGDHPAMVLFRTEAGIAEMRKAGALASRESLAIVLANLFFESSGFRILEENGNYSAAALQKVWPRHYPNSTEAKKDERNPTAILNKVYGNRLGNTEKDDGWTFRGRGYIQLTGRENYRNLGTKLGLDLESNPDTASRPEVALKIALHYLESRGAMELVRRGDILGVRRKISSSSYGLKQVEDLYLRFLEAFDRHQEHPLVKSLSQID